MVISQDVLEMIHSKKSIQELVSLLIPYAKFSAVTRSLLFEGWFHIPGTSTCRMLIPFLPHGYSYNNL